MNRGDSVWRVIAIAGLIMNIILWFMLGRLAEDYAGRVREKINSDPDFTPAYESWEADVIFGFDAMFTIPFIYLPTLVTSLTAALLPIHRKRRLRVAARAAGFSLGIFTLLYVVVLITSSP